jgi:hypothetical protein
VASSNSLVRKNDRFQGFSVAHLSAFSGISRSNFQVAADRETSPLLSAVSFVEFSPRALALSAKRIIIESQVSTIGYLECLKSKPIAEAVTPISRKNGEWFGTNRERRRGGGK